MSKRRFFGSQIDTVHLQPTNRMPGWRVFIWNKNRASIHDVVLGNPESPEYDISPWVMSINFSENIVFENNDDAMASSLTMEVIYDPEGDPIQITEKTMVDGTPIRVLQGDERVPVKNWVPIFTGVMRGVPTTTEFSRNQKSPKTLTISCVDRAEKYLNKVVTARAYDRGTDVGKVVVETAVEWMQLDRREIMIGEQGYSVGHEQNQLVDIEVLKGIAQALFTVGKKPRFNSDGFLVAADTDLDKAPARRYLSKDHIIAMTRSAVLTSINNSVRLLGLSNELTQVVERTKRLAHGTITAGFFEKSVRETIFFSEDDGKPKGGRRAKDTFLGKADVSTIGDKFGESLRWRPAIEEDGFTVFSGQLRFKTGHDPMVRVILIATWFVNAIIGYVFRSIADVAASESNVELTLVADIVANIAEIIAALAMMGIILSMTEIGRVDWEVHGDPFTNVYQQLAATAVTTGILTEDIKEIEIKNDWLFQLSYMQGIARELLRRELVKGWTYEIEMIDDPLIEVDDIIDVDGLKFYITSIRKRLIRPGTGVMKLTAWRTK